MNDGSKDRSSEIAHSYQDRYPQTFRVIDKENGNYGSCVNRGLNEATGKYIKLLDADDSFDTNVFMHFLTEMQLTDVDMWITDTISVDEDDSDLETDDLPEEISIPKEDEMFVESTSTDFMDSVKDNTDDTIVSDDIEEASLEDDIPLELPEDALTESEAENIIEEDDVPTVEKVLEEGSTEISFEDTEIPETQDSEEPVFDETAVDISEAAISEETPVMDDTEIAFEETSDVTIEEPVEDKFAEVDNLDNNLTDDNMNYLTAKENKTDADSVNITSDLKQDIKSVLLYMDQLLENLPEEKIVEFAKSDEFTTYKKLFTELGLS